MRISPIRAAAFAAAVALSLPAAAQDAPTVVASIKPVHSLVSGVMEGIGEPHLLVRGGGSPHSYALRPSDAEALSRADAVFWIGEELETFLQDPIRNIGASAQAVALIEADGLTLMDYEDEGHAHEHGESHDHGHDHGDHDHAHDDAHDHDDAHEHDHAGDDHGHGHEDGHGHGHAHGDHHGHSHSGTDPHIWLDPRNAAAMVDAIAATLGEIDPGNASTYDANAEAMKARLGELDEASAQRLEPVREVPFLTFHDAMRYFSTHYGLAYRGAITLSPERQPGAQRLAEIREEIAGYPQVCIFAEPQFPPGLVDTIVEGTEARSGVVDPLGADIEDGPDLYFKLIESNVEAIASCLDGA